MDKIITVRVGFNALNTFHHLVLDLRQHVTPRLLITSLAISPLAYPVCDVGYCGIYSTLIRKCEAYIKNVVQCVSHFHHHHIGLMRK